MPGAGEGERARGVRAERERERPPAEAVGEAAPAEVPPSSTTAAASHQSPNPHSAVAASRSAPGRRAPRRPIGGAAWARLSSTRAPTPTGPRPIQSDGASGAAGNGWKTSRSYSSEATSTKRSSPIPKTA